MTSLRRAAARPGRPPGSYVWEAAVSARDIARWRGEVAGAVRALGGDAEAVGVARLGVSELLSNVVRHVPDSRCRVEVERRGRDLYVRVLDRSPQPPVVTEPDWNAERGRGLWLLREMVAEFGHTRTGGGKAVWFRYPLGPGRFR
ncbi:ATP-binding protein [Streptomyces sp. TRM 70351]|uniref:ATP-binding protein n=1 Tax=Streptomyces sp. TRM 70351 TaxID=3116552 RepID=UPI002E7BB8FB|nr:ATP-binding protein [Streptomyces sp. TRM 70351]MEE1929582.1 ATP-binding protein [Streptomyces sp. TRM 70351]